jgi:hypothetical protein
MNLQDVFNNAWNHAVVKRMPMAAYNDTCLYRTPDGQNACLIGVSIKDSELEVTEVKRNDYADLVAKALRWERYRGSYVPYLHLQFCHDDFIGHPYHQYHHKIESVLREFAKRYELKVPE